jgi:hypothetical protein
VLAGVEHYGLAEYLGAGPDAVAKFEHGEIVNPVGHALVRVAADWRRAGFTRPIPRSVLTAALPAYLDADQDVLCDSEVLDQGLAWVYLIPVDYDIRRYHRYPRHPSYSQGG